MSLIIYHLLLVIVLILYAVIHCSSLDTSRLDGAGLTNILHTGGVSKKVNNRISSCAHHCRHCAA